MAASTSLYREHDDAFHSRPVRRGIPRQPMAPDTCRDNFGRSRVPRSPALPVPKGEGGSPGGRGRVCFRFSSGWRFPWRLYCNIASDCKLCSLDPVPDIEISRRSSTEAAPELVDHGFVSPRHPPPLSAQAHWGKSVRRAT